MATDFWKHFFAPLCHQIPERCLGSGGDCWPLCARCTGLYLGVGLAGLWLLWHRLRRRRPWAPRAWLGAATASLVLCILDGLSGASHAWQLGNGTRLLLGHGAGLALALWAGTFLRALFPEGRGPTCRDRPPRGLLAAALLLPAAVLLWPAPAAGLVLPASAAGWGLYEALLLLTCLELCRRGWRWLWTPTAPAESPERGLT